MLDDEYLSGVLRVRVTSANGLKAKSRTFKCRHTSMCGCCMYALGYFYALRLNFARTMVCEHDAYIFLSVDQSFCVCLYSALFSCVHIENEQFQAWITFVVLLPRGLANVTALYLG